MSNAVKLFSQLQKKEIQSLADLERKNLIDYEPFKQIWKDVLPSNHVYDSHTLTQRVKAEPFNFPLSILMHGKSGCSEKKITEKAHLFTDLAIRNETDVVFPTEG